MNYSKSIDKILIIKALYEINPNLANTELY